MAKATWEAELARVVGPERVLSTAEELVCYAYDATPLVGYRPDLIVTPTDTDQVAEVLKLANRVGFKVVPRGSGTNLSGGAVAAQGGVVLQLTGMNRILEIDTENLTATVEPGVITSHLHSAVEKVALFYPPDPGSMNISTMGGNVAEGAGGLRGLKYGVTRDYVLGLEVVLPTGEIINIGGKVVKNVAGYDLIRLMVGSEGTLGVITGITVKLIPLPEAKKTLLALYRTLGDAAATVSSIIAQRVIPATLEFLDRVTIRCVEDYAHVGLPLEAEAVLLIEVDGPASVVEEEAIKVEHVCRQNRATTVQVARSPEEQLALTAARRTALAALARVRPTTILEDVTVPRSELADMVGMISNIARKHRLQIGTFGHAGDGNLHPTILTDQRDMGEMMRVGAAIDEIFLSALELGGTVTGEHGIGLTKARYLATQAGDAGIEAMKRLKASFDPHNILNPGKLFVEEKTGATSRGH